MAFFQVQVIVLLCGTLAAWNIPNPCPHMTSCGECINVDPTCAWCPATDHNGVRCVQGDYLVPPPKDACNATWIFPYPEVYLKDLNMENALTMINRKRAKFIVRPGVAVMIEVLVKVQEKHRLKGKVYTTLRIPAGLETTMTSNCEGFKSPKLRKSWCLVPKTGNQVGFNVTITATRCLLKTARLRFVSSLPPRAVAKINFNSPCLCACEKNAIKNSPRCNRMGDEVCGQCQCNAYAYGERCECLGNDNGDQSCLPYNNCHIDDTMLCDSFSSTSACSGRGRCQCGICLCDIIPGSVDRDRYTGRWCECDDTSCPVWRQQLCGGATRGTCNCGRCRCLGRYTGSACEIEPEPCISVSGHVCSNRGRCINKSCQCTLPYSGEYCDQIEMNHRAECDNLKDCVLVVFGSGTIGIEEYNDRCRQHTYDVVEQLEEPSDGSKLCASLDPSDGLTYWFTFQKIRDHPLKYAITIRNSKG